MVRFLVHASSRGLMPTFFSRQDATMKVSVEILKRVYQIVLQSSGDQRTLKEDGYLRLDPEDHLHLLTRLGRRYRLWSPEHGSFLEVRVEVRVLIQ